MKKILLIAALVIAPAVSTVFVMSPTRVEAGGRNIFDKGSPDELEKAKEISLNVLRNRAARRGVGNVDEFRIQKAAIDNLKYAHTRVRQTIGGIPVWGGEAIVHLKPDGEIFAVTDDLKEAIAVSTQANFSAEEAINFAKGMYRGAEFLTETPQADLWVYRGEARDHLAYRVRMRREDGSKETAMPVIFIDAQTGEKIFEYDNLQTGRGASLYNGDSVTIQTYASGTRFYMEDMTRKIGTFDMANGTSSMFRMTDLNDVWVSNNQRSGVDAHYGASKFYDYFLNVHNRSGIDGAGGPAPFTSIDGVTKLISSRVRYGSNYNNAFWNGSFVTYGDGDGWTFSPLVTIDICAHEMTHGVTESTADLTYSGESGALNESMSDVFAAMIERFSKGESANNWKIAEEAYTPGYSGDAIRYLDDPHAANQPDHYYERDFGTSPSVIHINSGIANKAFYLAAKGGTHHLSNITVTGIGADDAAKIWYLALTEYMTQTTNFAGARTATLNAAAELFGETSPQYETVGTAWCAIGVGTCEAPNPTELIVNGGFESTLSPWVSSGAAFYSADGTYPHGGTGLISLGEKKGVSGQVYQTVSIPSAAPAALTFWLNVTSTERTATIQNDKMFVEVRNASGTLLATLATYSNLNKSAAGAYSKKTLNLSAYRGQTVRLQFRAVNDYSFPTTFRIDEVSLL